MKIWRTESVRMSLEVSTRTRPSGAPSRSGMVSVTRMPESGEFAWPSVAIMTAPLGDVTVTVGDGTKKLHTITPEGHAALEANKAAVDAVFERMERAGEAFGRGRTPQIMRAMQNFRMALQLKTSQGSLTEEQIRKVVEAIDEAAKQIEQS